MRVALGVEYDGSCFSGWQLQAHARSVQGCLEQALARVADHNVRVHCAGRTDAGVHARAQVAHFDTHAARSLHSWVLGTNANLPDPISVLWARSVSEEFHARFTATGRSYRYLILNRRSRPALLRGKATWEHRALDAERMHAAAQHLLGEHDFSAYRAQGCQAKSPVRCVRRIDIRRQGEWIVLDIEANAFLHHMVRNIAGVLMAIGQGKQPTAWSRQVLETRDRTLGGVTAPPDGLYLTRVQYPQRYAIPAPVDEGLVF